MNVYKLDSSLTQGLLCPDKSKDNLTHSFRAQQRIISLTIEHYKKAGEIDYDSFFNIAISECTFEMLLIHLFYAIRSKGESYSRPEDAEDVRAIIYSVHRVLDPNSQELTQKTKEFCKLLIDPGILYRLEEFLTFLKGIPSEDLNEMHPLNIRNLFKSQFIQEIEVYRGYAVAQPEDPSEEGYQALIDSLESNNSHLAPKFRSIPEMAANPELLDNALGEISKKLDAGMGISMVTIPFIGDLDDAIVLHLGNFKHAKSSPFLSVTSLPWVPLKATYVDLEKPNPNLALIQTKVKIPRYYLLSLKSELSRVVRGLHFDSKLPLEMQEGLEYLVFIGLPNNFLNRARIFIPDKEGTIMYPIDKDWKSDSLIVNDNPNRYHGESASNVFAINKFQNE